MQVKTVLCEKCGASFVTEIQTKRFCSAVCRDKAYTELKQLKRRQGKLEIKL